MVKKEKYITLKEAASISGYSPDYVGQLIRQGKIQGKQIFSNVAWITTEEAIRKYQKKENPKKHFFVSINDSAKLVKILLSAVICFLLIFSVFLFYVFSVSLDKKIESEAVKQQQKNVRR